MKKGNQSVLIYKRLSCNYILGIGVVVLRANLYFPRTSNKGICDLLLKYVSLSEAHLELINCPLLLRLAKP
jgi:hypothetical protein